MTYLAECFAWCMLQVTLFTAAATIVYWLMSHRRANANVRLLAVAFGVIAVLTFACISPWPRWNLIAAKPAVAPAAIAPWDNVARPNPDLQRLTGSAVTTPSDEPPPQPDVLALHPVDTPPGQVPSNGADGTSMRPLVLTLVWTAWIAAAIGALRFAAGLGYVIRYRRTSRPIDDETTRQEFERLRKQLGAPESVELQESPSLNVAATIGWRRPVILLPTAWRTWTSEERQAVLAHELAHVAQRHFPVWIASQLTTIAHFYHPLVHWLGRRLRLEQELAADQLAAETFGCRHRYAAVLASLAIGKPQPAAIVGLGLFMSRPLLMRRISMLRSTIEHRRPSRLVRVSSVLVLTTSAIAIAGLRASTAASRTDESPGDGSNNIIQVEPARQNVLAEGIEIEEASKDVETKPKSAGILFSSDGYGTLKVNSSSQAEDSATTNPRFITALIQISRHRTLLPPSAGGQLDSDAEWQVFRQTQLAVLQSLWMLQSALRDPELAELNLIKSQADPLRWLSDHLDAGFINASEIMYVRLNTSLGEIEELAKIVDAVVSAYMNDVVAAERQRQVVVRDALAKSFQRLNNEIQRKMEEQQALSAELGVSDGTSRDARSDLLLNEITELTRGKHELERKLADVEATYQTAERQASDGEDSPSMRREYQIRSQLLHRQIASLNEAIEDKSETFIRRGQGSVELRIRQSELKQLQEIAREMSIELEKMDVESLLPDRVRVIQSAM